MKVVIIGFHIGLLSLLLVTLPCFSRGGAVQSLSLPVNSNQSCAEASHLASSTTATNVWRGLVPLHSSRVEVERILRKPKWSHGSTFIYETECERVDVTFSLGACELSGVTRWNVAADVIIRLEVAPRRELLVKDLKLDANRYVRDQESHPANWVLYRSVDDGIRVRAILDDKEERVMVITYEPRRKDKILLCSSTK